MTKRSVPFDQQISACWSGIVTPAGKAVAGKTLPSAHTAMGRSRNNANERVHFILDAGLTSPGGNAIE
jgi:hypothetical protein